MRIETHRAGKVWQLGLPRLLTILLVLALVVPAFVVSADAHDHAGLTVVTAEASAPDASGQQDGACLVCHLHCGCHVGISIREPANAIAVPPVRTSTRLASDDQPPSAQNTQLIRPPKA